MLRVRHPGAPPRDIDLGPCPEVRIKGAGYVQAAPIGEMAPIILGTVHSGMSDGHGTPKAQAFSIHPEKRHRPLCGKPMKIAHDFCAQAEGHKDTCRTRAAMDQRNYRFEKRKVAWR